MGRLNIKSPGWPCRVALFAGVPLLNACGGDGRDDTAAVQSAVDRGGVIKFEPRIYYLSRTIVIHRSNTVLQGAGPQTVFQFQASPVKQHCANDRVFTTPCEVYFDQPARRIAKAIAIGDRSFFASDDASDIQPGDWLLITDKDAVIGDVVTSDWVQAESVADSEVRVRTAFRTAFANARPWEAGISGLGFRRVVPLVENTEFRNFNVVVPTGTNAVGISVVTALHTTIDQVRVDSFNGQPLYSYVSKDLTVTNSEGRGQAVLN
jgi:hypothetical protein